MVPRTAPGNDVSPPTTAYRNAVRLASMVKLPGSTCDWYADSAPARAAIAPDTANAASFVEVALAPNACAARWLSRKPMNIRPERLCLNDQADRHASSRNARQT